MSVPKTNKILKYINYRMRVTTLDGRTLVGQFLAFDKHMNMVLADCEEFRKIKPKSRSGKSKMAKTDRWVEEKRTLGLVILRGDIIVSLSVEGPPPPEENLQRIPAAAQMAAMAGPGIARPAGRGMPIPHMAAPPVGMPPPGILAGPARGLGPSPMMMPPRPPMPGMVPPMMGSMPFPRPPMPPGMMPPPPRPGMMMPPTPPFGGMPPPPPGMFPRPSGPPPPGMMPFRPGMMMPPPPHPSIRPPPTGGPTPPPPPSGGPSSQGSRP
jgi:small nuclear ribonucleoprotein B and B'